MKGGNTGGSNHGGGNNNNNNMRGGRGGGHSGGGGSNNRDNNNNNNGAGRSQVLAEFLQERWNAQSGFLDMDELPPTSHNISVVISRLLNEAKYLFGDQVQKKSNSDIFLYL